MLLTWCKSCQYCLESLYWRCCEERFCFDEKIAAFNFEDVDPNHSHAYVNMGASTDSIVTTQPSNNNNIANNNNNVNNSQQSVANDINAQERVAYSNNRGVRGRELTEIPINADKIYEVFSKSMIFREYPELTKSLGSVSSFDDIETKSEPDNIDRPNRTKVYFEDEINSPITDFEIMFKDELLGINYDRNGMFKIDEEQENEGGLTMNVKVKKPGHDMIKPSSITTKDHAKITTTNPVYEYDHRTHLAVSTITIPKADTIKSILRVNKELPRSHSAKNLTRIESTNNLKRKLTRVESLKNMETKNLSRVLSRVPHRSATFLNFPDNLQPEETIKKSDTVFALGLSQNSELSELRILSHLPDTPIIKSTNLPKFFAESPAVGEYKKDISLQSIKQNDDIVFFANDYSMPRYYGISTEPVPVHQCKSMPDLRVPAPSGKVSKRLVKLRSKLKPLVIKKGADDRV